MAQALPLRSLACRVIPWLIAVAALVAFFQVPFAAVPSSSENEKASGLSTERLSKIHRAIQQHIDAGEIAGAVTLVARRGQTAHLEAHGLIDLESKRAMRKDAIFRLASMSKPITGVAVLMLMEDG